MILAVLEGLALVKGVKAVTGRNVFQNKQEAAEEYVNNVMLDPNEFTGGTSALEARISSETDSCAAYVKSKGVLVSGARETCANAVQQAYSDVIARTQAEQKEKDQIAFGQMLQVNKAAIFAVVAVIVIILLIYFF